MCTTSLEYVHFANAALDLAVEIRNTFSNQRYIWLSP